MLGADLGLGLLNVTYTLFREGVATLKDMVNTNPAPSPPPRLPVPPPHVMRKGNCLRVWRLAAGQGAGSGACRAGRGHAGICAAAARSGNSALCICEKTRASSIPLRFSRQTGERERERREGTKTQRLETTESPGIRQFQPLLLLTFARHLYWRYTSFSPHFRRTFAAFALALYFACTAFSPHLHVI